MMRYLLSSTTGLCNVCSCTFVLCDDRKRERGGRETVTTTGEVAQACSVSLEMCFADAISAAVNKSYSEQTGRNTGTRRTRQRADCRPERYTLCLSPMTSFWFLFCFLLLILISICRLSPMSFFLVSLFLKLLHI